MIRLQVLVGDDTNETHRVLHRHQQLTEIYTKKSDRSPVALPMKKLDYLLKQKASQPRARQAADGMLQLPPSDGTSPFTVFGGRSIGN